MSISIHKSLFSTGGGIGDEILSGVIGEILPTVTTANLTDGATISKKFYIKNLDAVNPITGSITLGTVSVAEFTVIIFEGTGDSQLEGDLLGNETNQSPIAFTIPASSHQSYWVQVQIAPATTTDSHYNSIDTTITYS